jgi:hypothetical protein
MKFFKAPKDLYWLYWHFNFRKYNEKKLSHKKLRLVLGLGRSGTTWVTNTLVKSKTPLRYFEEPLFHINPKLKFNTPPDHTAIDFSEYFPENHPLVRVYRIFCHRGINLHYLPRQFVKRNDVRFEIVLVKEVHGLLGTEALAKKLNIPILVITRNILSIVDSLINAQAIDTPYLLNEYQHVKENRFLNYYFPGKNKVLQNTFKHIDSVADKEDRLLLEKLITSFLITKMFEKISQNTKNVLLKTYEDLCEKPNENYAQIADFFSIDYNKDDYIFSRKDSGRDEEKDHYSLVRNTQHQLYKPHSAIDKKISFINNFFKKQQIDINYTPNNMTSRKANDKSYEADIQR